MKLKVFLSMLTVVAVLIMSCSERPSKPNVNNSEDTEVDIGDGGSVTVPVDTNDYWKDNEQLLEIYSNQMKDVSIINVYGNERYKLDKDLNLVDPDNPTTIYKRFVKVVLVKVNDKINDKQHYDLHGKNVAAAVYQVATPRGVDKDGHNEAQELNQPYVGGYEIIFPNYGRHVSVKIPPESQKMKNLYVLYRVLLPESDANSSYKPYKVFDGTYKRIGGESDILDWLILPQQESKKKANKK